MDSAIRSLLKALVMIFFWVWVIPSFGQQKQGFKMLVPDNSFRHFGYRLSAGASITTPDGGPYRFQQQVHATTTYDVSIVARGKMSPVVGVGVFIAAERGIFRYYSFEVDYFRVRASEVLNAFRQPGSDQSFPEQISTEGTSSQGRFSMRFAPQFLMPLGRRGFIHHGPGVLIQSSAKRREDYQVPFLDIETRTTFPGDRFTLDYGIGIGMLVGPGRFIDLQYRRSFYALGDQGIPQENILNATYIHSFITLGYNWLKKRPDRLCIDHASGSSGKARFSRTRKPRRYPW